MGEGQSDEKLRLTLYKGDKERFRQWFLKPLVCFTMWLSAWLGTVGLWLTTGEKRERKRERDRERERKREREIWNMMRFLRRSSFDVKLST